ncbi:VanW family protein [Bacillus sp. B-jedd]|uniref:VanW family protein n=1 Tax=Bacillus sp. B-jedd TaxID=1476857 RepID=UPI00051554CE|nr:VanW family protein [Bacillus sp. B-jedd]CEG27008.1 putative factor for cell wall maintenance or synthesis [Bacillus sp. B-jedd]
MILNLILSVMLSLSPILQPASLTFFSDGKETASVTREEMALLPFPGSAFPSPEFIDKFIRDLKTKVDTPPRDAGISMDGTLLPEQTGRELDRSKMEYILYSFFYKGKPLIADIPYRPVYPRVDSELLDSIRAMLIGRYTTFFNPGNRERSHNIHLAAETLNGKIVFPGETFSFNKEIGKRTAAKGYLKAPIIVRGELSEGIGGGICQVSSTLFNAADHAGMSIVQRYSHTKTVTYVPSGRDATVSWYGPDFKFRNPYSQPVLIRAKSLGSTLSVSLYSAASIDFRPRSIPGAPALLPEEMPFKMLEKQPGS